MRAHGTRYCPGNKFEFSQERMGLTFPLRFAPSAVVPAYNCVSAPNDTSWKTIFYKYLTISFSKVK
jgi:hypothetical protein